MTELTRAKQHPQKIPICVQVIDVVRSGVSSKAPQHQPSLFRFAELLHPERAPFQNRHPAELQRIDQVVRGFRRAGERSWKNLRMRHDKTFLAADRALREKEK